MAIALGNTIVAGGSTSNLSSYVTGTLTNAPGAGRMVVGFIDITNTTAGSVPTLSSVTGGGITTWAIHSTSYHAQNSGAGTQLHRMYVVYAMQSGAGSTTQLTITTSAAATSCAWHFFDFTGCPSDTAANGANNIVQVVWASTDGNISGVDSSTATASGSSSLGAASHVDNRPVAHFNHATSEATNPRASWTELSEAGGHANPPRGYETQWRSDTFETTYSATWATACRGGGIALELRGGVAATYTYNQPHFRVRSDDTQGLNTDAGWAGALDANVTMDAEKLFRIRFEVDTADVGAAETFKLQYRRNAGTWTDVTRPVGTFPAYDPTAAVEVHESAQFADNAATTNLLSGSSKTFSAGAGITADITSPSITLNNQHTEYEFPVLIRLSYGDTPNIGSLGRNVDGDTFEFRLIRGTGAAFTGTYVTPTITLNVPTGLIGGTIAETPHRIGPFEDANGNLYYMCEYAEPANWIQMLKSTDGGRSWVLQDAANMPTSKDQECVDAVLVGDTLWLLHMGLSIWLHSFRVSTHATNPDTWSVKDEVVHTPSVAPADQSCSMVVRGDGTIVAFYNTEPSGTAQQVGYRIRSAAGSWGAQTILDTAGGTADFSDSVAVLGASNKTHVFYQDHTGGVVWHRSLTSANVLSAREQVATGLDTASASEHQLLPAIYYDDAGAETIVVGYRKSGGGLYTNSVINDGTPGTEQQVTATSVANNIGLSDHPAAFIANDGNVTYCFWADAATQDLWVTSNTDLAGWGTSVEVIDNTTVDLVQGVVFTHSALNGSATVVGMIYDDTQGYTGGQKYYERTISVPPLSNTAEGGTDETTVTTGNSGGASGDAWSQVGIGASNTLVYDTAQAMEGSLSYRATKTAGSASAYVEWGSGRQWPEDLDHAFYRGYFFMTAAPSVTHNIIAFVNDVPGWTCNVRWNTDGTVTLIDSTGALGANGSVALSTGVWYRIEVSIVAGATGTGEVRIYQGHSTIPIDTIGPITDNFGTAPIVRFFTGFETVGGTGNGTIWFDDIAVAEDDWIGPSGTEPPGTVAFENKFDGGSDNTAITTGNSGGASGTAWDVATVSNGTLTYESTTPAPAVGGLSGLTTPTGVSGSSRLEWTTAFTDDSDVYVRVYYYTGTNNDSASDAIILEDNNINAAQVWVGPNGIVQIRDASGVLVETGTNDMADNTWYRIEYHAINHDTTGSVEVRVYEGASTTPYDTIIGYPMDSSGSSAGGLYDCLKLEVSWSSHSAHGPVAWDQVAIAYDGWIGPATPGPAPVSDTATGSDTASVSVAPISVSDTASGADTAFLPGEPGGRLPVLLTEGTDTTALTSYTTASFTPSANGRMFVVFVACDNDEPGDYTCSTSLSGVTFTQEANVGFDSLATPTTRMKMWTATVGSSPGSGTITFSGFPDALTGGLWKVFEIASEFSATDPFPQAAATNADDAQPSPSDTAVLGSALVSADSIRLAFMTKGGAEVIVPESGDTDIGTNQAMATPAQQLHTSYKINDTGFAFTWSANSRATAEIAFEVAMEPVTAGPGPVSDSGTGSDTSSLTRTNAISDAGTGTETVVIALTATDSGTGSDTSRISLTTTDSGTGADTSRVSLVASDTATGTETAALTVTVTAAESGTGADTSTTSVARTATDSGTGSDTVAAPVVTVSASDTAVGTETPVISLTATDSGTGSEASRISLTASDTGTGSDTSRQSQAISDTASGADTSALATSLTATDSGTGADLVAQLSRAVTDSGTGSDTSSVSTATQIAGTDAGSGTDTVTLTFSTTVADSGTGADTSVLSFSRTETGTGTDTSVLSIRASDSANGTDTVALTFSTTVTDTATGADTAILTVSLTSTDTGISGDSNLLPNGGMESSSLITWNSGTRIVDPAGAHSGLAYLQTSGTQSNAGHGPIFTVDPDRGYTVSAWVRYDATSPDTSINHYLGFEPHDAVGGIFPYQWFMPGAVGSDASHYTTLTGAVSPGTTTIPVADTAPFTPGNSYVCFNANVDQSDIPNRSARLVSARSVSSGPGNLTVSAIDVSAANGSTVRRTVPGGTYMYTAASAAPTQPTWTFYQGTASGRHPNPYPQLMSTAWWPGTDRARVLTLANYNASPSGVTNWDDLSVNGLGPDLTAVLAASDVATGTDTASVSTSITASDTGIASDTSSLAAADQYLVSDSGVGTDSVSALSRAISETGSGAETSHLARPVSDAATGTDTAASPTVSLAATEAATGSDLTSALGISLTDSGTASDFGSTGTPIFVADSGSGADTVSALSRAIAETGAGSDTSVVSLRVTETASGADTSVLDLGIISVSASDTAAGADQSVLAATGAANETALGLDTATVSASITSSDTATSTETPVVGVVVSDTGVASESSRAGLSATDSASGSDTARAGVSGAENGSGSEQSALAVTHALTDTATSTEALVNTLVATDSGTGSETTALAVGRSTTDTGAGADTSLRQVGNDFIASDIAVGVETALVTFAPAVSDAAAGADVTVVSTADAKAGFDTGLGLDTARVSQSLTDSGSGLEQINISVTLTTADQAASADSSSRATEDSFLASDAGVGLDVGELTAFITAPDTGTGLDTATQPTIGIADAGAALDEAALEVVVAVSDEAEAEDRRQGAEVPIVLYASADEVVLGAGYGDVVLRASLEPDSVEGEVVLEGSM